MTTSAWSASVAARTVSAKRLRSLSPRTLVSSGLPSAETYSTSGRRSRPGARPAAATASARLSQRERAPPKGQAAALPGLDSRRRGRARELRPGLFLQPRARRIHAGADQGLRLGPGRGLRRDDGWLPGGRPPVAGGG